MLKVMPSQVVQTIDNLFPHAQSGVGNGTLMASHSPQLRGILGLIQRIPDELINLPADEYSELILAISTVEYHLETWISRGDSGTMANVKGRDAVTVFRGLLVQCPDEYPPQSTTELSFISDAALRESIRRDVGAANRALNNSEWKAATVLAGAAIEALLLWAVQQSTIQPKLPSAVAVVVQRGVSLPANRSSTPERWDLNQFIEIAAELALIKSDTKSASLLAKDFRNLIHPGRAARLAQECNRGTALTAVAALEHVVSDLTP